MKVSLYIEEGITQIILTPNDRREKDILSLLSNQELSICHGSFYECQGGWVRQGTEDDSTILVLRPKKEKK